MSSHNLSESTEQSVIEMHFDFDNSLQLCGVTSTHVIVIKPIYSLSFFMKMFIRTLLDETVSNSEFIALNGVTSE
jgi:hypothetical protein